MPLLGDILAAARSGAASFEAWLENTDPQLCEQVKRAAEAQRLSVTKYVRTAIADFSRLAPEEDWANLTSNLRQTNDPGTRCLLAMVHWRLTARGCAEHQLSEPQAIAEGAP